MVGVGKTIIEIDVEDDNYFIFTPEEEGVYEITTSDSAAKVSYWGGNTSYIFDQTSSTDYQNNAFTRNITPSMLGCSIIICVKGADSCILEITRISDPILSISDMPLIEYEPTVEVTKFTMPVGITLTAVDVTEATDVYKLVLSSKDGYYHMDTEDGPILYMDMKAGYPVALTNVITNSFEEGIYDSNGTPLYRVNYRNLLEEYCNNCDSDNSEGKGWYPVTYDLRYIVEHGGAAKGWWDKSNPNSDFWYSATTGIGKDLNPEIAWMYSCSYG